MSRLFYSVNTHIEDFGIVNGRDGLSMEPSAVFRSC